MTTYTVTIARTVFETVNVQVTAENEAAAIEKGKEAAKTAEPTIRVLRTKYRCVVVAGLASLIITKKMPNELFDRSGSSEPYRLCVTMHQSAKPARRR